MSLCAVPGPRVPFNAWSESKSLVINRAVSASCCRVMTAPPVVVGRARPKTTSTTSAAATATTSAGSIDKPKKETNPRQPHNPQNAAVKLKVVVRGLPPNLPEAVFKETTKEWINETAVDWYYYVPGKLHER